MFLKHVFEEDIVEIYVYQNWTCFNLFSLIYFGFVRNFPNSYNKNKFPSLLMNVNITPAIPRGHLNIPTRDSPTKPIALLSVSIILCFVSIVLPRILESLALCSYEA